MRPWSVVLGAALVLACGDATAPRPSPYATVFAPIQASARAGDTLSQVLSNALTSPEHPGLTWSASIKDGGPWLALKTTAGVVPDSLVLRFDPRGLAVGLHRDTVLLVIPVETRPSAVPIEFQIH